MELIKITNQYLSTVNWAHSTSCVFDISDGVDVWRIPVSLNLPFIDTFLAIMPDEEITRYNRFYRTADKNRYIISRGAVRNILGKYLSQSPASLKFGEGKNKKPYLINPCDGTLSFNISHSGDWILMTVAKTETGADTEYIDDHFDFSDIIGENFSNKEIAYINTKNGSERFYMLWTRKEALIKATGIGIIDCLDLLPSLDGNHTCDEKILQSAENWLVSSFKLDEKHAASIAINPVINQISFFNFNLNQPCFLSKT